MVGRNGTARERTDASQRKGQSARSQSLAPSQGRSPRREVALLQTFADQAVIAIENVRLFKELEARNRDLTETPRAADGNRRDPSGHQPAHRPTCSPSFDTIAGVRSGCAAGSWAVLYRFDGELIHFVAQDNWTPEGLEPGACTRGLRAERPQRVRAILDRTVVHVPDFDEPGVPGAVSSACRVSGIPKHLVAPMLREDGPIGAVSVARAGPGPFSGSQIALLQTFADQAVIAVENVRLFKELEARTQDLGETLEQQTATADILRAIAEAPIDVQPIFDAIVHSARRLCGAWGAGVWLCDGDLVRLVAAVGGLPGSGDAILERGRTPRPPVARRPAGSNHHRARDAAGRRRGDGRVGAARPPRERRARLALQHPDADAAGRRRRRGDRGVARRARSPSRPRRSRSSRPSPTRPSSPSRTRGC